MHKKNWQKIYQLSPLALRDPQGCKPTGSSRRVLAGGLQIHKTNYLQAITLAILLTTAPVITGFSEQDFDLVELVKLDPTMVLDIRYATVNNFTRRQVYPSTRCFLRRAAAAKLKQVQKELCEMGLGLKIFDGYRPFSVQELFWKVFPHEEYVARPVRDPSGRPIAGSKHNRGAAVDLTLIDLKTGKELEMPSGFDDLSSRANRNYTAMAPAAAKNCKLLEDIMVKYGFEPLPTEWWHFDLVGWQAFDLLDISFE